MPTDYTGVKVFHKKITIPSDGDDETGASVSSPLEAVIDNTAFLNDRGGQLEAVNWGLGLFPVNGLSGVSGTPTPMPAGPPVYEPSWGRWIWGVDKGSGASPRYVAYQSFDGQTWTQIGTSSFARAPDCVAALPDGTVCMIEYGAHVAAILAPGGSSWSEHSGPHPGGANNPNHTAITAFGSKFVAAYSLVPGSGAPPGLSYSSDGITWNACTGTFANMGTTASPNAGTFAIGSSLAFFSSSDNSKFYTSTDGIAWTQGTLPDGCTAAYSATFDAVSGLFYVLMFDGVSKYLYSSSNLSTWTRVKTFATYFPIAICASGTLLVLAVEDLNGTTNRLVLSVDGGVTWRWTQLGGMTGDIAQLATNGSQFVYSDATLYAASTAVGLPIVATIP